jgi:hypothetical protein
MEVQTPLQPAVVTPKQALSIKPFGFEMDVLLTSEATGGATSVIVAWHKPGEGPPNHVHFKQEEILFIIEGLYEVTVSDETTKAGPGSIVFIPRNVGSVIAVTYLAGRRRHVSRRERSRPSAIARPSPPGRPPGLGGSKRATRRGVGSCSGKSRNLPWRKRMALCRPPSAREAGAAKAACPW